ncbi:NAD(P)/FAD-dependent oxidoreductase [Natranaeroarchaeum sulfidigenes]|uniref:NADH dehydrogenase, FAD-containing subunit n=1 Tax=Natranaeroarchaeum sulfidigenes TaxID=2784880 RepID=A0A897MLQ7_9EURY|nr:FAD-dependent oxidoreductase [Natranaeroarchaeum sulfidigenes]QSG03130.1 NADH dehydrogenase, FAD-containing subunit [Natranaeroarchaeum sulfidigenes]
MNVLVLGGGYAGVALTQRLEDRLPRDVDVRLIDDTGDHLVQQELHRVIRKPKLADEITIPLEELVDRAAVETATVTGIDVDAKRVELDRGRTIEYDYAAVALGAETAYYDIPGLEANSYPVKRVPDAERIRDRFLDVLDATGGRVIVGGAGLSGIQVAGELAELAREENETLNEDPEIQLLEMRERVAPGFSESFSAAIARSLDEQGVQVRTGATVARVSDDAITLADGDTIDYDLLVWTGGLRGPAALDGTRPETRSTLKFGDGTFVLGDAARVVDDDGEAVPASAQVAVREAKPVADTIVRSIDHRRNGGGLFDPRPERFTFDSPGWVVSVGDDAVAQLGPAVVTGRAAAAAKATVGASYLSTIGRVRDAVKLVDSELGPEPKP